MRDDRFESTEELSINEVTVDLDNTTKIVRQKLTRESRRIAKEEGIDQDFASVIKKSDYKRKDEKHKANIPEKEFRRETKKNPKRKVKLKLKKWVYYAIGSLVIIILGTTWLFSGKKATVNKEELITKIKSHYSEYVKVNKDSDIYSYDKTKNKYESIGTIYKNAVIKLDEEKVIDEETKYFHVMDSITGDYYIPYEAVDKSSEPVKNTRYKNYLLFDKAVVASDFTLYLDDEKLIHIKDETELPIIINDYEGKYYVEYNDMLVSIKKEEVKKLENYKIGESKKNQSKITTLAYHRINDTNDKCTDPYICLRKSVFDKQMKYLSDNNYFTLTMEELYMYLNGNIKIEKGVVITFDDGYLFKAADEVLDKYKLNGTMFVISGNFTDYSEFKNLKAIEVQSHTHDMHRTYVCPGGNQGGAILCASKKTIVDDLNKSVTALDVKPFALAYPFYDFNDNTISALKEAGFKMAFVGRYKVMGKATPKETDMYKIPRMTVWEESEMSFNSWKSYL